jgi:hypothetical protein
MRIPIRPAIGPAIGIGVLAAGVCYVLQANSASRFSPVTAPTPRSPQHPTAGAQRSTAKGTYLSLPSPSTVRSRNAETERDTVISFPKNPEKILRHLLENLPRGQHVEEQSKALSIIAEAFAGKELVKPGIELKLLLTLHDHNIHSLTGIPGLEDMFQTSIVDCLAKCPQDDNATASNSFLFSLSTSSDKGVFYINPANDIAEAHAPGRYDTVRVTVYNNGLWKVAITGNSPELEEAYKQGHYVSKQTYQVPEDLFSPEQLKQIDEAATKLFSQPYASSIHRTASASAPRSNPELPKVKMIPGQKYAVTFKGETEPKILVLEKLGSSASTNFNEAGSFDLYKFGGKFHIRDTIIDIKPADDGYAEETKGNS